MCWGTSQVRVRAVSPMGDAQVPKEEPEYCTFGGVTACSAHLVELCCLCSYGTNLLLPCMRTCLTASLRALAYRSLVLRAARLRTCFLSGRPVAEASPPSFRVPSAILGVLRFDIGICSAICLSVSSSVCMHLCSGGVLSRLARMARRAAAALMRKTHSTANRL